jgi:hypothetical protein
MADPRARRQIGATGILQAQSHHVHGQRIEHDRIYDETAEQFHIRASGTLENMAEVTRQVYFFSQTIAQPWGRLKRKLAEGGTTFEDLLSPADQTRQQAILGHHSLRPYAGNVRPPAIYCGA